VVRCDQSREKKVRMQGTNQRNNETTKQRINESTNQRINETTNQRNNESTNQRNNESTKQRNNESTNLRINEVTNLSPRSRESRLLTKACEQTGFLRMETQLRAGPIHGPIRATREKLRSGCRLRFEHDCQRYAADDVLCNGVQEPLQGKGVWNRH
jgi:hypothetical protein